MIAYLIGTLIEKSPVEVTVEVSGVGFTANISANTYAELPEPQSEVKLLTYLYLREETLLLYGFMHEEERAIFKMLLSVGGVGPKMAQTILSGMDAGTLRQAIISGNSSALMHIPGVGKKTAERILVELRDKLAKLELKPAAVGIQSELQQARSDAYSALLTLGFSKPVAEKAMRAAIAEAPNARTDELLRLALKYAQK
ncbi:MAG: Holliday junction branch migration protein RuvA [Candidatus Thermochlorobacter aerophilum]|jgi:Holliday junction DNA helicase RuvA|uniref:Holliday junction branch migration complex subunit RuvA n=1 Tax=Candidatus Thermochlorobacter aerophilus TaxID=1868324 RepID=A0A395LXN1_9BACT|nr:MAG: Holliday junction branch migration protein RuvA [Candidatus Thermochlorobacter aerophilum]